MAKWPKLSKGETLTALLCLFGRSDPPRPPEEQLLPPPAVLCVGRHGGIQGREVWHKLGWGLDILEVRGYDPFPQRPRCHGIAGAPLPEARKASR